MKSKDEALRGAVGVMDTPDIPLGPHDVKIKVAYCAICGSDPHLISGIFPNRVVPFGLGHEVSGVVTEVGPEATIKGLKVGTEYTVAEKTDWTWRYGSNNISIKLVADGNNVTFTNSLQNNKWLTGGAWCDNSWAKGSPNKSTSTDYSNN